MAANSTYKINEQIVKDKLLSFNPSYCESHWQSISEKIGTVRTLSPIALPKVNSKLVLFSLAAIAFLTIAGFGIKYLRELPLEEKSTAAEPLQVVEQEITPQVSEPEPQSVAAATVVTVDSSEIKKKLLTEIERARKDSIEKAAKLLARTGQKEKSDSLANNESKRMAVVSPDSSTGEKNTHKRRKKRRKRDSYQNIDDVRQSSLIHRSSDDEVVVPGSNQN